ncbi:bifunctional 5,10-methylenetetrahydrofolate dehydrogenase/5,10-methenyltetrahydrofolate cyclohydrolase [Desulfothermobacter acidiphilus]|uniref:bifunctional 5,10-methylenetetrahydrofolate dehydrogenase/5,10-methenyltetrahydrofolate cyclohydrolase n=1 Tax=Desulfothermobacter acidiphilus TaxID=1938353 RepID=UPI003F8887AB
MAVLLAGKEIAAQIREEVRVKVEEYRARGIIPQLVAMLVGDNPASVLYAQAKEKAMQKVGILYRLVHLSSTASQKEVEDKLGELSAAPEVHGILLELPLPGHLDRDSLLAKLSPCKDVDGLTYENQGRLLAGTEGLFPATPQSCLAILEHHGLSVAGRRVVVVGRGATVGRPLLPLLLQRDATVTVCHSRTRDLAYHTRQAEVLIVAVGRPRFITGDMVSPGAVVVDAGINQTEAGTCGDVDFDSVAPVAAYLTPVPGGVGSLTTAIIMQNLLRALSLQGYR